MGRERDIFKKVFFSRIFIAALAASMLLVAVSTGRVMWRKYQIEKEINGLKKEITDMEKRNQDLLVRLDSFNNSDQLEKEARLQLNVKRPGEKVVVIVGNEASATAVALAEAAGAGQTAGTVQISNPLKWWRYFFGGEE